MRRGAGRWRVLAALFVVTTIAGCGGSRTADLDEAGLLSNGAGRRAPTSAFDGGTVGQLLPPGMELTGAGVVPGPGNPDAAGSVEVVVVEERSEVCVEMTVRGLAGPTAVHLHEAAAGEAGDVVLGLPAPTDEKRAVDACVSAEPDVLERLQQAPAGFYVSVHSESFPDGALRAQLG